MTRSTTQGLICLVVLSVLAVAVSWRSGLHAQDPIPRPAMIGGHPASLVTHVTDTTTGQQLTVIDSQRRTLAIYLIEKGTGRVTLKSVRQLHWDLQLEEFNGVSPTPREIQTLLSR